MSPPILNYTTRVPVSRTVQQVHELLVAAGTTEILTEYLSGEPVSIAFGMLTPVGSRRYRLPVRAAVAVVLRRSRVEPRYATDEHAARVAWRILKDWVEAQLAIIRTEMVTFDEVMLPYMMTPTGSVYELFTESQLGLPAAKGARS